MDTDLGILGIDYPEFKKDGSYEHFRAVWGADNEEKTFGTGNVELDYVNAFNHLVKMGCSTIIHSSSIDNFLMDNKEFYEWAEEDEGEGERIVKKGVPPKPQENIEPKSLDSQ